MLRNTALVIALLAVVTSCSGSSGSDTSSSSASASTETVPAETTVAGTAADSSPDSSPGSSPGTPASSPTTSATTTVVGSGNSPTPTTIPAATPPSPTQPPAAKPTSPPAPPAINPLPEPTLGPAPASVNLVDKDCPQPGAGGFDLLHINVKSAGSSYRFSARYSGNASQHDILVSFDLGGSTYVVTAELFEDGRGVGQISGGGATEATFLDPPQTIVAGNVVIDVPNTLIASISGTPFPVTVSLKADGADSETCR